MKRFDSFTKPLTWFMAILLAAFVAGCGGGSDSTPAATGPDTTAPTVISTVPLDAASGVAISGVNVTATFSEAMDAATITDTTFTLAQGASAVSGVVATPTTKTATFTPNSDLAPGTLYTATVTTGAKDLAGNALASNKVWTFTTVAAANPSPVLLGTAGNYVIFSDTAIGTATTTTYITGNIGLGQGVTSTAFTGFTPTSVPATFATFAEVSGNAYAFDYAPPTPAEVTTASTDMGLAYVDAAGRTATSAATTDVGGGTLTSLTLTRGVYQWGSAITIPTDLTLSGSATDVWIFKVAGTLDMAAAKNVVLTGGALPQNVFWQASGVVTIGAGTHFKGIILGQTAINFGDGSAIDGRLLAQTAVNLNNTAVTQP